MAIMLTDSAIATWYLPTSPIQNDLARSAMKRSVPQHVQFTKPVGESLMTNPIRNLSEPESENTKLVFDLDRSIALAVSKESSPEKYFRVYLNFGAFLESGAEPIVLVIK